MKRLREVRYLGVGLLLACAPLATASDVIFTLQGGKLSGPASTDQNGFVKVVLVNDEDDAFDISLNHVKADVAMTDYLEASKTLNESMSAEGDARGAIVAWLKLADTLGGMLVPAHSQREVYLQLQPGSYVAEATLNNEGPASYGYIHTPLSVKKGSQAAAPKADLELQMMDFRYDFPATLPAGEQLWHVSNAGKQPHIGVIFKLNEGVSQKAFMDWLASAGPDSGPPPATDSGFIEALSVGQSMVMPISLEPATYVVICFLPDLEKGMPHFMEGMVSSFTAH